MRPGAQRTESTVALGHSQVPASTAHLAADILEELGTGFESAVAFADYCSFLTAGSCGERSAQLVEIAEALLAETVGALGVQTVPGDGRGNQ